MINFPDSISTDSINKASFRGSCVINKLNSYPTIRFLSLVLLLVVSTFNFTVYSQQIGTFNYGGSVTHQISSVVRNNAGEVFMVGKAYNYSDFDILVVKLSESGEFIWRKFYGVPQATETPKSAYSDGAGGLFIFGQSSSTTSWAGTLLMRVSQNGEIISCSRYAANSTEYLAEQGVTMAMSGNSIYLGGTANIDNFSQWDDYFLIETDLNCEINWARSFGGSGHQTITSVSKGNDEFIVSAGEFESQITGVDIGAGVGKYNSQGDPIWIRRLEYGTHFSPESIKAVENGYIIYGKSDTDVTDEWNLVIVKLSEDGETLWSKELLLDGDESPADMKIINGNIIVSGHTDAFADQDNNVFTLSLNLDGDINWQEAISGSINDYINVERENLILEGPGDYIQLGYSSFSGDGSGSSQFCLSHISPSVNSTCGEFDPGFEIDDIDIDNFSIALDTSLSFSRYEISDCYMEEVQLEAMSSCVVDINIFIPDSISLCASANDSLVVPDFGAEDYLWSTGETTQGIQPEEQGWYWAEVNIDGSVFVDSVFVNMNSVSLSLGPNLLLCPNESLGIEPLGQFNSITWFDGSQQMDYTFSDSGTYWAEAELDSCFAHDTIQIDVIEEPEVDLGNDLLLCSPADSILVNSELDPNYNFEWNNGGDEPQSYYSATGSHWLEVTIEDCTFDYDFEISLATQNLIEPTELTICDGSSVEVGLIEPEMDGSWNIGETGSEIEVEEAGTYVVEVSEQGCLLIDSVQVELIQSPEYGVEDQEVCPGTTYIVETPGFAGQVWVNGLETTESEVEVYAGNHQVQYIYYGCSFSVNFDVDYTKDTLDFDTHYAICDGDTLVLSVSDSLNPIWDGFAESSTFSITQGGNYELAFEMFECTFRETIEVRYEGTCPCPEPVFIPNSFTPNSDGNNEFFRPVIYCPLDEYHLMIFNRWGQKVFDSKDPEKLWDGSNRGGDYFNQNDTFQYVLQYSKKSSTEVETVRGHVTVVR